MDDKRRPVWMNVNLGGMDPTVEWLYSRFVMTVVGIPVLICVGIFLWAGVFEPLLRVVKSFF